MTAISALHRLLPTTAQQVLRTRMRRARMPITRSSRHFLAVLGALIALEAGVAWIHWSRSVAERVRESDERLDRERRVVRAAPYRSDSIVAARRKLVATSDQFVIAPTRAQAATLAASILSDAAQDAGVRLGTVDARADSIARAGVRAVTVEGEAAGSYPSVIGFVRALEGGAPFTVRQIAITPVTEASAIGGTVRVRFTAAALARHLFAFER